MVRPKTQKLFHKCKAPGVGASAPTLSSNKNQALAPEEMVFVPLIPIYEITLAISVSVVLALSQRIEAVRAARKELFFVSARRVKFTRIAKRRHA